MELPAVIDVHLAGDGPSVLEGILVSLDLHYAGRYYFGTLVGLSDATGQVRLTRDHLERHFAGDQRLFLMDYRVPLAQCDAEAVIRVEGGRDFIKRRPAPNAPLIDPAALALWQAAANERIASTSVRFRLDQTTPDGTVRVTLPVRAVHGWFR